MSAIFDLDGDDTERAPMDFRAPATDVTLSPFRPGEHVPGTPYVVVGMIGQGGMGEVYEVEHGDLGRRCALKVLHRNHRGRADLADRMRAEARTLGAIRHPNLVDVFDMGMTPDERPYFAMELLRGRDLRAELSRFGIISVPTALGLVIQTLDGLGAAHAAGIIHRDVKLENLFLCDDGALKILDFGVAKVLRSDAVVTQHGRAIGTPRTMSPEQCRFGPVDARSDVYAAGLVLYELLAGRGPFDEVRDNHAALRFAHCERTPPPPSRLFSQPIPYEVEHAILKAVAKAPQDRFQSAAEMADVLRKLRGERRRPSHGTPQPPGVRQQPVPRRISPWFLALAVTLGFILGRELPRAWEPPAIPVHSADREAGGPAM